MVEYRLLRSVANPTTGDLIPVVGVFGLTPEHTDYDVFAQMGGVMIMKIDGVALHNITPSSELCGLIPEQLVDAIFAVGELADSEDFQVMLEHEVGHCVYGHTGQPQADSSGGEAGGIVFQLILEHELAADAYAAAKFGKSTVANAIVGWTIALATWAGYTIPAREEVVKNLRQVAVIAARLDALQ